MGGGYPEATLRAWAARLRLFRFVHAVGGHANDADELVVAFACPSTGDLRRFLAELGVPLVEYDQRPPQPESGVGYRADQFERFPSLIRGTEWIAQPGHCMIAGQKAFCWVAGGRLTLSLGDYTVTESHVRAAEAIETVLAGTSLEVIDPPADSERCICPKYHPEYFP